MAEAAATAWFQENLSYRHILDNREQEMREMVIKTDQDFSVGLSVQLSSSQSISLAVQCNLSVHQSMSVHNM